VEATLSRLAGTMALWAQEAGGGGGEGGGGFNFLTSPISLMMILLVFFYLIVLRPQRQEQAKRRAMLAAVKKNDRVVTVGGIYGVVTNVHREADEVTIRVDEATNTKLRVTLSSLARVMGEESAEQPPSADITK
jgi:preprotein translocase subunit YajC